jgi:cellulose synthase/poly-beta-1,6-N-acetylglucosamine synthase-like glycosyltransferase
MMSDLLAWLYLLTVALLSVYGIVGLFTLRMYWRHRGQEYPPPQLPATELPFVTVQLPVFNERYVIERLIDAAVHLEYPRDRVQIQVVDDSTDDTVDIAATLVAQYRKLNINIEHVRRFHRNGYKAGALSGAMEGAQGDYVAIFDADFRPEPDFLLRTIPHFLCSPNMGMIQARWGHLNAGDSPLTAAQSIALDKHFVMEQTVRHRANLFPKFNGAAGIWRRTCIEDAGGWQADTVCEDLCLSTRAILNGWEFRFLPDVIAPAELPDSISAYKNQQARWAKGSIQCLNKYWGDILKDGNYTWTARLYALLSMSAYATHFLLLVLLLLQIPLLILDVHFSSIMFLFTLIGLGQPLLFVMAQKESYPDWGRRLLHFPTLLLVAIGTAPSNSRAMVQAFSDRHHPFIRTPKGKKKVGLEYHVAGVPRYQLPFDGIMAIELFLAAYAALGIGLAIQRGNTGPLLLLLTSLLGFGYVFWMGFLEVIPQNLSGWRATLRPRFKPGSRNRDNI